MTCHAAQVPPSTTPCPAAPPQDLWLLDPILPAPGHISLRHTCAAAATSTCERPGTELCPSPPPAPRNPAHGRRSSRGPAAEEASLLGRHPRGPVTSLPPSWPPAAERPLPPGPAAAPPPAETRRQTQAAAILHLLPPENKNQLPLVLAPREKGQKEVCCQYMKLSLSEGEKKTGGKGENGGGDKTAFLLLVASQLTDSASLVACHLDSKTKPSSWRGERRGFG